MTTQKAAMTAALEALEKHCTAFLHHEEAYVNAIIGLRAALAETAEPVAGWKLVPVEPTLDMLKAALDADPPVSMPHWTDVFRARWSAMLNTAPQPPAPVRPVHQFRKRGCADWYDGLPDHEDGGGPYETRTLYTQPPAPAVPVAWRPIETAPKDGSLFLCWVDAVTYGETDEGQPYETDVSQVDFCSWRTDAEIGVGWFEPCCGQISDRQGVTHWMPLPADPRTAPQPPAPAVELTDEELHSLCNQTITQHGFFDHSRLNEFARAAIAAHEKKRGGA